MTIMSIKKQSIKKAIIILNIYGKALLINQNFKNQIFLKNYLNSQSYILYAMLHCKIV